MLLLIVFALSACADPSEETSPSTEAQAKETSASAASTELTLSDIKNRFFDYAQPGWEMLDCVTVTDSEYGIIGVVQYTTQDYAGCRFDFLKLDGVFQTGVGALPAGEDRLVYTGNDTVSCELLKNNGEAYTCTISYYESGSGCGFKIVG